MLQWFAVQSKRLAEVPLSVNIAAQGFPVFLPLVTEREWHNKKLIREVTRPLFSRIVFTQFDRDISGWQAINNTRGAQGPIAILGTIMEGEERGTRICRPSPIREKIIMAIRNRDQPSAEPPSTGLTPGKRFVLPCGPFVGFEAEYLGEDDSELMFYVECFGRKTATSLPLNDFLRAKAA